jgi:endonuclease/exonuclease/phosphatase family metal-dependent hydrolase
MMLRILTYNIHKGIGGIDRSYQLGRIAAVLEHYRPDVALLQEVDDGVPRSRGVCQVEVLGEMLGLPHRVFQPNVRLRRGVYGNAILSRWPIHDDINIDLTIGYKKRRGAQVGRLHLEHAGHRRTVVVVNLHLGLAGFERRIQLRRLLAEPAIARLQCHTPLVIGGDFNDMWGVLEQKFMTPLGFKSAVGRVRTFPAAAPLRALDAIYYRGGLTRQRGFVGHIAPARLASDHLPLVAEFELDMAD